jgi:hypothetical protein
MQPLPPKFGPVSHALYLKGAIKKKEKRKTSRHAHGCKCTSTYRCRKYLHKYEGFLVIFSTKMTTVIWRLLNFFLATYTSVYDMVPNKHMRIAC